MIFLSYYNSMNILRKITQKLLLLADRPDFLSALQSIKFLSVLRKQLVIGQFSAFHWSVQSFCFLLVTFRVVHLLERTETGLITASDQTTRAVHCIACVPKFSTEIESRKESCTCKSAWRVYFIVNLTFWSVCYTRKPLTGSMSICYTTDLAEDILKHYHPWFLGDQRTCPSLSFGLVHLSIKKWLVKIVYFLLFLFYCKEKYSFLFMQIV